MSQGGAQAMLAVQTSGIHGFGLFSKREVRAGCVILEISGTLTAKRSVSTFQVGHGQHLKTVSAARYINHSCDPTCFLRTKATKTLQLVARIDVGPDNELTVDYAAFEHELPDRPGFCKCGSPNCRRVLTGYRDLAIEQQALLAPYLLPYLALVIRVPYMSRKSHVTV